MTRIPGENLEQLQIITFHVLPAYHCDQNHEFFHIHSLCPTVIILIIILESANIRMTQEEVEAHEEEEELEEEEHLGAVK